MSIIDIIKSRRSITKYDGRDVKIDVISWILDGAIYAPNSGNLQNWKVIIVKDENLRHLIAKASLKQMWMAQAPVHLVICNETANVERMYGEKGKNLYSVQNCAALAQNILLLAKEKGLASCWVGAIDKEQIRNILKIPGNVQPETIITLGYSNEKPSKNRHGIEMITYFDGWGTKIVQKAPMVIAKDFKKKSEGYIGKIVDWFKKKDKN
jgi:nitroreductase